jgi:adenine-specific DNA-methyltransferase
MGGALVAHRTTAPGPTPIDAIKHADKRANIPTADAHDFVDPSIEEVRKVRYARDESLDPQLVWRGKYSAREEVEGTDIDLVTDAPPIYIQEKIDPRVLIENLRKTAARPEDEPELTLFDYFDGLNELDQIDFYKHDANWSNRMILGDSLQVMASLAEREKLRGKIQMVYIDPPYGIRFGSNWQVSARSQVVKDGRFEDASREAEQIKAFRDTWERGIHSYLSYLRDRLLIARDLMTESGSCFVQIGDENSHLIRSLMDEVFGSENFVSQIVNQTTGGFGSQPTALGNVADFIVWYAKSIENLKYRQIFTTKALGGEGAAKYQSVTLSDGSDRRLTRAELSGEVALPPGARPFRDEGLSSQGLRTNGQFAVHFQGRTFLPPAGNHWKTIESGIARLALAGRLLPAQSSLSYKRYIDDFPAIPL